MARSERTAIDRRGVLRLGLAGLVLPLAGCGEQEWYGKDATGLLPDLSFELTRALDGAAVTQSDYRGRTVALFFGYTFCLRVPRDDGRPSQMIVGSDSTR